MQYDLTFTKNYCSQLGLQYLGDDWVAPAATEAYQLGFTQTQFDAAMKHHLFQVKTLFTAKTYKYSDRMKIAFYFLTGLGGKK